MTLPQFFRKPLKENLKNIWLKFKAHRRYWNEEYPDFLNPPEGYEEVWGDDFSEPWEAGSFPSDKWRRAHPWGDFHESYLDQYYDTDGNASYTEDGELVLKVLHENKHYIKSELPDWRQGEIDWDERDIPYKIGLITSRVGFQYGWFECEVMLPRGKYHWPAFWLYGDKRYPPEIDIFEAYSQNDYDYNKGNKKNWRIQPNFHYAYDDGIEKKHESYGARDYPIPRATERYIQFACWWERDFIKIYYAGKLVTEIRDPRVLRCYNGPRDTQQIVLNHGCNLGEDWETNGKIPTESEMLVRNLRVYQKK